MLGGHMPSQSLVLLGDVAALVYDQGIDPPPADPRWDYLSITLTVFSSGLY